MLVKLQRPPPEIIIFRPKDGGDEHFCLVFGKTREILNTSNQKHNPLVRIHSQCITGDVLDSLKCDCGQQLKQSIMLMADQDEGILIYLAQEGRDIGLLDKLQDEGYFISYWLPSFNVFRNDFMSGPKWLMINYNT